MREVSSFFNIMGMKLPETSLLFGTNSTLFRFKSWKPLEFGAKKENMETSSSNSPILRSKTSLHYKKRKREILKDMGGWFQLIISTWKEVTKNEQLCCESTWKKWIFLDPWIDAWTKTSCSTPAEKPNHPGLVWCKFIGRYLPQFLTSGLHEMV